MAAKRTPKPTTPPHALRSLEDMKPRPAPTGRVSLTSRAAALAAPPPPPPERTITTDQSLWVVTKETDTQTIHLLVRARTREEAVKAAGYERANEVAEVALEGEPGVQWECSIQNVEEDDYFGEGEGYASAFADRDEDS